MSGWRPSSAVWCVEWRGVRAATGLPSACSLGHVLPIPVQYSSLLLSCRVLSRCRVCGVVRCVCLCGVRVVGYPMSIPPSRWWWVGPSWMVGWHGEVGWHGDGRAGAVRVTLLSNVGAPSSTRMVVLLNGGGGVFVVSPCSDWGWHLRCPRSLLCCPALPFLLLHLCVCCHAIVGLWWCLCVMVVSLWNGGVCDGVCGLVSCSLFLSSFLSLPFRVGVRGSARAALRARTLSPNTIVFSSSCSSSLSLLLLAFLLSSVFPPLEWRWWSTMCQSVRWA